MNVNRKYINGYIKDNIKILEVTSLSLTQYIERYLKEEWGIYTFQYIDIPGKLDDNIQVYKMQYTPLISEEKLIEAILSIDDSIIIQNFNARSHQAQAVENINAPSDWEDYWNCQQKLSGSFASENFQNAKIEKLNGYNEVVNLTDEFRNTFPFFSKLLNLARVTKITSESNGVFYLLGWSYEYGYFGGLMPEIEEFSKKGILDSHQQLLNNFGGFIDWFGEVVDSNYFCEADHSELTMKYMIPNPHFAGNFIQFTEKANGDFYCYHKKSGEVWKYCHEGYGAGIIKEEYGTEIKLLKTTEYDNTLLFKIDNCSFTEWVERGAKSWHKCFEELPFNENKQ